MILAVYRPPVPLADVVPQLRRRAGQLFKLLGALNMEFASEVHALRLIVDVLLYDRRAYLAGRRDKIAPRPERRETVQTAELLSHNVSARSFELVNHLVRSVAGTERDGCPPERRGERGRDESPGN